MTANSPNRPNPPNKRNQPDQSGSVNQPQSVATPSTAVTDQMVKGWQPYQLDHWAQQLVIQHRYQEGVLGESHKMRMACAYGLERFWGEHLRFESSKNDKEKSKGKYWKAVWKKVAEILAKASIQLPDAQGQVKLNDRQKIEDTAKAIWSLDPDDQRIALMVLTQFCDSLVWWTQRYKLKEENQ